METIKRKRVTQVGSGAYSVYLPKKWIDTWPKEQQAGREVDLHLINGSLLIVPVLQDRAQSMLAPSDALQVRSLLLSSYVRGHERLELSPKDGRFDNDCITAARDFLRHLDERLVATVGPTLIGFELRSRPDALGQGGEDLLQMMGAKLLQVLDLAAECVEHSSKDPDRTLHAARLLVSIQDEDVARLFHQTLRRVATLELPLESVSDFQFLDLAAFLLHSIGTQACQVAQTTIEELGLTLADLDYPRADLLKRLKPRDLPPPVVRDMLLAHRSAFHDAKTQLAALLAALPKNDAAALGAVVQATQAARTQLQARLFDVVVGHWGEAVGPDIAQRAFAAYQLANPIANILGAMTGVAMQAVTFTAAKRT